MNDALDDAEVDDGEGALHLTLTKSFCIIIDGDIRIYLKRIDSGEQVRLVIIAPKEVPIKRSNHKTTGGYQ